MTKYMRDMIAKTPHVLWWAVPLQSLLAICFLVGGYDETATVCKLEEVSHQNPVLFAPRLSTSRTMRHECLLLISHSIMVLCYSSLRWLRLMPVHVNWAPPTPPRGHWKDTWKLEWHLKGVSPMNSQSEDFEDINSYSDVSILVYLSLKDSLISVVITHKWSHWLPFRESRLCARRRGQVLYGLSHLILSSPRNVRAFYCGSIWQSLGDMLMPEQGCQARSVWPQKPLLMDLAPAAPHSCCSERNLEGQSPQNTRTGGCCLCSADSPGLWRAMSHWTSGILKSVPALGGAQNTQPSMPGQPNNSILLDHILDFRSEQRHKPKWMGNPGPTQGIRRRQQ